MEPRARRAEKERQERGQGREKKRTSRWVLFLFSLTHSSKHHLRDHLHTPRYSWNVTGSACEPNCKWEHLLANELLDMEPVHSSCNLSHPKKDKILIVHICLVQFRGASFFIILNYTTTWANWAIGRVKEATFTTQVSLSKLTFTCNACNFQLHGPNKRPQSTQQLSQLTLIKLKCNTGPD